VVLGEHRDPGAGLRPVRQQRACDRIGLRFEFGIAGRLALEQYRDLIAPRACLRRRDIRQTVDRVEIDHRIPPLRLRIQLSSRPDGRASP